MATSFLRRVFQRLLRRPEAAQPAPAGTAPTGRIPEAVPVAEPSRVGRLFDRLLRRRQERPPEAQIVPDEPAEPSVPEELQDEFLTGGQWLNVASSNVEAIRYEWDERKLYVRFLSGSEYLYFDVDPEAALAFTKYPSPGRYVWRFLRGVYDYKRVVAGTKQVPSGPRNKNVVRPRRELDHPSRRREYRIPGVKDFASKWRARRGPAARS